METFAQSLVSGVLTGALYAMIGIGLTVVFGVMRIINLAHGDIAILGAYLLWVVVSHTSLSPFLAALLVLPAMLVFGYALYMLLLERSRELCFRQLTRQNGNRGVSHDRIG